MDSLHTTPFFKLWNLKKGILFDACAYITIISWEFPELYNGRRGKKKTLPVPY